MTCQAGGYTLVDMTNKYAGRCYKCGHWVDAGTGTAERNGSRWVVCCAGCHSQASVQAAPVALTAVATAAAPVQPSQGPVLTYRDGVFVFLSSYEQRAAAKAAGFFWHGGDCRPGCAACAAHVGKVWWTRYIEKAARLAEYADASAQAALAGHVQAVEASRATDAPTLDVPVPDGLAYLPYQKAGIAYAMARESTLLADEMGCIDGESLVHVNRAGAGRNFKLRDLYNGFNGLRRWDLTIPTSIRALCGADLRLHRVRAVLDKGTRPVVRLTLASGKYLRLTSDHEVCTVGGSFVAASELKPGDGVLTNGTPVCTLCGSTEGVTKRYARFPGVCRSCVYRKLRGKPTFKTGRFVDCDGYVRVSGMQDHPRANRSGQVYEHILVMEATLGRVIGRGEAVHHKNGDGTDNRVENLEVMLINAHAADHGRTAKFRHLDGARSGRGGLVRFKPVVDTVVTVKPDGEAHVYDVVCDDPHRNFVVNGIVVHNCGKTIQAIGVINADPSIKTALVIVPASLRLNWKREMQKWLTREFKIEVLDESQPLPSPDVQIVVVNYERVRKAEVQTALMAHDWDLLISDESHRIKSPKAQQTVAVLGKPARKDSPAVEGLVVKAKRKLFLTGTPILNKPVEIHPLLAAIAPAEFGNFMQFTRRYCAAHQERVRVHGGYKEVWNFDGASNLPELQERLRAVCMCRRLKRDVLSELPAKRRAVVVLPQNGAAKAVKAEQTAWQQHELALADAQAAVECAEAAGDEQAYQAAVAKLHEAQRYAFSEISKARHDVALAKLPSAIEHITDALESTDKIVIWGHHHDVIDGLYEAFRESHGAVRLRGGLDDAEKQAAVDRFQNDPTCRVFIGSIQAAGVGITLTAGSTAIFVELDWVPALVTQAEDRQHRIGQTQSVNVQHLVLDESLDARMAHVIVEKQAIADAALDLATGVKAPDLQAPCIPGTPHRNVKPTQYPVATVEQREACAEAMRNLAGVCDGARELDGMGFNKFDAATGHRLAKLARPYTDGECWLAARLATKYRNQLDSALVLAAGGKLERAPKAPKVQVPTDGSAARFAAICGDLFEQE